MKTTPAAIYFGSKERTESVMPRAVVSVVQFCPGKSREGNFSLAAGLIDEAASQGGRIVVLPEMFSRFGPADEWRANAETSGGPTEEFLRATAAGRKVYVVGGSFLEKAGDGHYYNTCPVVSPEGAVIACYRKMHLFWTDIPGATSYDERSYLSAGDSRCVFEADGFRVAVGICYDLRFPEFFRLPGGRPVDLYCLPAAFMEATGRAHWDVLVRSRAVENLAYFAAAGTAGRHYEIPGRPGEDVRTYGHSMIVSPWGETLAAVSGNSGVATALMTREEILRTRSRLGALDHIRGDLWGRKE